MLAEERRTLGSGRRTSEEVALSLLAAQLLQESELARGLDALSDRAEMQVVCQANQGGDDARRVLVLLDARDEGTVDLDAIDGQLMQVAQRGIAGAEVIEGHANSQRTQLAEH